MADARPLSPPPNGIALMEWFEITADFFGWIVPISAVLALWFAYLIEDHVLRCGHKGFISPFCY